MPTFNRVEALKNLLFFIDNHNVDWTIIILDSSSDENKILNKNTVNSLKNNIKYIDLSCETPPLEKFRFATTLVDTKYSAFCADDDVVIPYFINKLIIFLEKNSSYSVAQGWSFSFSSKHEVTNKGNIQNIFTFYQFIYDSMSYEDNNPGDRVYNLLTKYQALSYGVHRADTLKRAWAATENMQTPLLRELVACVLAVVEGKVARLNYPHYGRCSDESYSYDNSHPIQVLLHSSEFLFNDFNRMRECVINELAAKNSENLAAEVRLCDLAYLRYLTDYCLQPEILDNIKNYYHSKYTRSQILHKCYDILVEYNKKTSLFFPFLKNIKGFIKSNIIRIPFFVKYIPEELISIINSDKNNVKFIIFRNFRLGLTRMGLSRKDRSMLFDSLSSYPSKN